MEKTRVNAGEKYWYIALDCDGVYVALAYDNRLFTDIHLFVSGNYFATKESAETMASKLRAALKGADVIKMPSEEDAEFESNKLLGLSGHDGDKRTEEAYLDGFADCLHWLKSKIM